MELKRWGPIEPYTWPQDKLRIPGVDGGGARFMPPVEVGNVEVARQEAFTMSGRINLGAASPAGGVFNLTIPTDQDGDFWCDQMYMIAWVTGSYFSVRAPPSTISISDLRTGRALTYPGPMPSNFLATLILFSDDAGFDPASSPLPDGFRSTSTLAQPFCFTRQGGIQISLNILQGYGPATTVDIAFGGWKEYTYASA